MASTSSRCWSPRGTTRSTISPVRIGTASEKNWITTEVVRMRDSSPDSVSTSRSCRQTARRLSFEGAKSSVVSKATATPVKARSSSSRDTSRRPAAGSTTQAPRWSMRSKTTKWLNRQCRIEAGSRKRKASMSRILMPRPRRP